MSPEAQQLGPNRNLPQQAPKAWRCPSATGRERSGGRAPGALEARSAGTRSPRQQQGHGQDRPEVNIFRAPGVNQRPATMKISYSRKIVQSVRTVGFVALILPGFYLILPSSVLALETNRLRTSDSENQQPSSHWRKPAGSELPNKPHSQKTVTV